MYMLVDSWFLGHYALVFHWAPKIMVCFSQQNMKIGTPANINTVTVVEDKITTTYCQLLGLLFLPLPRLSVVFLHLGKTLQNLHILELFSFHLPEYTILLIFSQLT